jgi:hypothetical protein
MHQPRRTRPPHQPCAAGDAPLTTCHHFRAVHPEQAPARPHPTAVRIARAAVLIGSAKAGVGFAALAEAGFTSAQLAEHMGAAEAILST